MLSCSGTFGVCFVIRHLHCLDATSKQTEGTEEFTVMIMRSEIVSMEFLASTDKSGFKIIRIEFIKALERD